MTSTAELVKNWLAAEGFKCTIDADGDAQFKYQGLWMLATMDSDDPLYLKILLPRIYEIDNDREKVMEILNGMNTRIKCMKGFIAENSVHLCIEMYVDSSPEVEDFLERCLEILVLSRSHFIDQLRNI